MACSLQVIRLSHSRSECINYSGEKGWHGFGIGDKDQDNMRSNTANLSQASEWDDE